jgi:hypothetical protein
MIWQLALQQGLHQCWCPCRLTSSRPTCKHMAARQLRLVLEDRSLHFGRQVRVSSLSLRWACRAGVLHATDAACVWRISLQLPHQHVCRFALPQAVAWLQRAARVHCLLASRQGWFNRFPGADEMHCRNRFLLQQCLLLPYLHFALPAPAYFQHTTPTHTVVMMLTA